MDYYGVIFDHLVDGRDHNPEVLQLSIIELKEDQGPFADGVKYANDCLKLVIDPVDYVGKRVLVVPRCCCHRKGTQDRGRINGCVADRGMRLVGKWLAENGQTDWRLFDFCLSACVYSFFACCHNTLDAGLVAFLRDSR
jgi:hypothetical protein